MHVISFGFLGINGAGVRRTPSQSHAPDAAAAAAMMLRARLASILSLMLFELLLSVLFSAENDHTQHGQLRVDVLLPADARSDALVLQLAHCKHSICVSVSPLQLTGELEPTSGSASLHGWDILQHPVEAQQMLGYCPQYDALLPELTARETLQLFSRLRGIAEDVIPEYVEQLLLRLGLQEGQADRPCGGYSGGNKRKLCLGVALVGNPVSTTLLVGAALTCVPLLLDSCLTPVVCCYCVSVLFAPVCVSPWCSWTSRRAAWIPRAAASCGTC